MVIDWAHIAELAFMGILSYAGTMGGMKARLRALEETDKRTDKELARAHSRIDQILNRHR